MSMPQPTRSGPGGEAYVGGCSRVPHGGLGTRENGGDVRRQDRQDPAAVMASRPPQGFLRAWPTPGTRLSWALCPAAGLPARDSGTR